MPLQCWKKTFHRMKVTFKEDALLELFETGRTKDRKYKTVCKKKKLVEGYNKGSENHA